MLTEEDYEEVRRLARQGKSQRQIRAATRHGWAIIKQVVADLKKPAPEPVVVETPVKTIAGPRIAQPHLWSDGWQMQAIDPKRLRAGR